MVDLPLTTTKLLDCLCAWPPPAPVDGAALSDDQDSGTAWKEIDARYCPVLVDLTRAVGLSQADAEGAAQWALAAATACDGELNVESMDARKSRVTRALKELGLELTARCDQDQ